MITSRTQYPGTQDRCTDPGNSFLKIDILAQRRSPWLLLLFICIASLFPLFHQTSRVINPLNLVEQEIRCVKVDLIGPDLGRWSKHSINTCEAAKNNTDPKRLHRDPASTSSKQENSADTRCGANWKLGPHRTVQAAGRRVDNKGKNDNLHQDLTSYKGAEAAVDRTSRGWTNGRRGDNEQRRSENLRKNSKNRGVAEAESGGPVKPRAASTGANWPLATGRKYRQPFEHEIHSRKISPLATDNSNTEGVPVACKKTKYKHRKNDEIHIREQDPPEAIYCSTGGTPEEYTKSEDRHQKRSETNIEGGVSILHRQSQRRRYINHRSTPKRRLANRRSHLQRKSTECRL